MKDTVRVPFSNSVCGPPVSLHPPVDRAAKWVPGRNVNQRIWHVARDFGLQPLGGPLGQVALSLWSRSNVRAAVHFRTPGCVSELWLLLLVSVDVVSVSKTCLQDTDLQKGSFRRANVSEILNEAGSWHFNMAEVWIKCRRINVKTDIAQCKTCRKRDCIHVLFTWLRPRYK